MKLQCLIVDDEPIAQQILEQHIAKVDALHLVEKCGNALDALNVLHREKIDVLFLDIKMPSLSGLDMLKTLQNPPYVILTTAFSEFGAESYEYDVKDYLLKPIAFHRFLKAVNKILMSQNTEFSLGTVEQKKEIENDFIFFKADKKIHKLYFKDIQFIEGSGNYAKIHSQNAKSLMVLDKLSDIIEKLPSKQFFRVHKSYIINVQKIKEIEGNRVKIGEKAIPISASYKQAFEHYIKQK